MENQIGEDTIIENKYQVKRSFFKYAIIFFIVLSIVAVIIYIKSKFPNDKYHYTTYASTEEIMQNFEENKSNYEEFISYFESSEYNRNLWNRMYEKCDHHVVFSPYPHNGKSSIKGVIDETGQAKLEDIFLKTGICEITRKPVGGGYYGFSYWCKDRYWITFYYIITEDTDSLDYKDTKAYLCQDNYVIISDNWLYKIVEY